MARILSTLLFLILSASTAFAAFTEGSDSRSFAPSGASSVHYTYDDRGNITSRTDARGVVTNYTWDALNRVTDIAYLLEIRRTLE